MKKRVLEIGGYLIFAILLIISWIAFFKGSLSISTAILVTLLCAYYVFRQVFDHFQAGLGTKAKWIKFGVDAVYFGGIVLVVLLDADLGSIGWILWAMVTVIFVIVDFAITKNKS